jgi:DNA-binding response OmpR family regulator
MKAAGAGVSQSVNLVASDDAAGKVFDPSVSESSTAFAPPVRVLVVEDEDKMRSSIAKALRLEGWHAAEAARGRDVLALLRREHHDLVLLDWMLPDRDGLDLLGEIRTVVGQVPVLMLTARGNVNDKVAGLDTGADDYVAKPFSMVELIARCRVLLRRPPMSSEELVCGDLKLNARGRCVVRDGREIPLTPQETDLLECLFSHQGEIVTRDMLEAVIWKRDRPLTSRDNMLDVLVLRLRQKIEAPGAEKIIRTVRGIGYRVTKFER